MECDRCGAQRPRMGPCPECGAPPLYSPPGGGSSGSGARGRSQPGSGSSGGRRASSPGAPGRSGGLLTGRPRGGDSWDDGDYGAPAPGRSGGRYSSGGPGGGDYGEYEDYGGVDPSRALAQYNEVMPPSAEGSLMTGLPGFPQSDEEERSIGLRRPAYIPATEPKRKKKLSSARILSGVLSILVVSVGVCGGLGFLGQRQLANFLSGPLGRIVVSPTVNLSQVPVTPVSTPGPSAKIVTSAITAGGIDKDYNAEDITSFFTVNSTVYVVVNIVGASQKGANTLTCRWFLDGIDYNLKSGTTVTVQPNKTNNYHGYCGLPYYQTGVGMVKVYWDKPASDSGDAPNDQYLAQTIKFAILTNLPGTITPPAGTPKSGTATPKPKSPTPSPTKKASSAAPLTWRPAAGTAGLS